MRWKMDRKAAPYDSDDQHKDGSNDQWHHGGKFLRPVVR